MSTVAPTTMGVAITGLFGSTFRLVRVRTNLLIKDDADWSGHVSYPRSLEGKFSRFLINLEHGDRIGMPSRSE